MTTRYRVEIDLSMLDKLGPQADAATSKFDTMASKLRMAHKAVSDMGTAVGSKLVGVLDFAARKAYDLAKYTALIGGGAIAAAGIAMTVEGVTKLNSELETAQISLAAIFNAQGQSNGVPAGLEKAKEAVAEMRQDAKKLPGEFSDLLNIFQTAAVPAFQSGLDVDKWEKLSAKVMATAKAVSLPMDQAAREFAALLEGRSGAHNVFGMRLLGLSGDKAEKFNKSSSSDRLKVITTELDKYGAAIDTFGGSWEGLSSSFLDNVNAFKRQATEPLFDAIKSTLRDVNEWFDKNSDKVSMWASRIGENLVAAFEWGKKKIEEWWPVVRDFASAAWTKLKEIWEQIAPSVERAGKALKEFMKDPESIDKLITLAKLYLALKVGQAGFGLASDVGTGTANGVMGLVGGFGGLAGKGGVGAAVGGLTGGGGGLGGMGDQSGGLQGAINAPLGGGIGIALALVAGQFLAVGAAASKLTETAIQPYTDEQKRAKKEMADFVASLEYGREGVDTANRDYIEMVNHLQWQGDDLRLSFLELAMAAADAANNLRSINRDKQATEIADFANDQIALGMRQMVNEKEAKDAQDAKKKKGSAGHGGTSIQKVEIVVTSNQNPSRIARKVFDELDKFSRNPRSSRDVRNYSNATPF